MLRTRSRSIDLASSDSRQLAERCVAKKFSWRTNLLCGLYSQDITSSIFYNLEAEEEVYLRRRPQARQEETRKYQCGVISGQGDPGVAVLPPSGPRPGNSSVPARPGCGGQGAVRARSRRWSMAQRTGDAGITAFQRRFRKRLGREVTGSLDSLQDCPGLEKEPEERREGGQLLRRLSRRVTRGESGQVLCEAVAVKDCHPSPYDRQALAFRRGDRIEVLRMGDTGIWRGRCQGREGNFKFIDVRTEKLEAARPSGPVVFGRQISKSQSVTDLLSSLSLEKLTAVFVLNGYDTAGDIEQLCEEDLEYLGIAEGGQRQLLLDTARHLARKKTAPVSPSSSSSCSPSTLSSSPSSTTFSGSPSSSSFSSSPASSPTTSCANIAPTSFLYSSSYRDRDSDSSHSSQLDKSRDSSRYSNRDSGICLAEI